MQSVGRQAQKVKPQRRLRSETLQLMKGMLVLLRRPGRSNAHPKLTAKLVQHQMHLLLLPKVVLSLQSRRRKIRRIQAGVNQQAVFDLIRV